MKNAGTLVVTTPSDREIVMTRVFDAPRDLVFDAHTKPQLLKRWLTGPDGWTMDVCDVDLRVGGTYRFVWRHAAGGSEMGMGGVYREIVRPECIVQTERFDQAWYPGEGLGTLVLREQDGRTTLTSTMLYESKETRDMVLKSGMEGGVSASYDRLATVLESQISGATKGAA
ncbi:SRPBCC family protein [Microvirga puerhi]|uniref:SRPBCC family protein n=1 Tax=Microvirga puerhi TaxID=2876078 RepID=A0ABS7VVH7_9HYPH|nr:SRPBCC family protein [Microvirga puerhi]MBZ6079135.1 SRPBCC family protein [Microvirga puerhi]